MNQAAGTCIVMPELPGAMNVHSLLQGKKSLVFIYLSKGNPYFGSPHLGTVSVFLFKNILRGNSQVSQKLDKHS